MTAKLTGTSACSKLRNEWYSEKFMKGQWDKEECVAEWEAYRACIMKNVEDKNLSRLLKLEATAYPTVSDPGRPLHSEDGSK
ncbi:uncharacterized protein At4g33100 isoform X2 [Cryptomeria japonica]|uniref:uncharacterized protein At4g33100 isoform X2 n=1 Tax=Cryptomeria japonica TaxID=3369 RepID=UPI0025ACC0AD|nr:uncharacterized protein At4g33100 isoform X2 [Cryptomeria japonica]